MDATEVSIIFPAHNEERRIDKCLQETLNYLQNKPLRWAEVIVVENGSRDETLCAALSWQDTYRQAGIRLNVHSIPDRGKGLAVKSGMLLATGVYRLASDVDLSVPIETLDEFLDVISLGAADIVIASREAAGARRIGEPLHRHWMGRMFNACVQALVLPGISDSQCGFKLFSSRAADILFPRQKLAGMAFDAEVLYLAAKYGFDVYEFPVEWTHDEYSVVRPVTDSFHMARDLLRVRYYDLRGQYAPIGQDDGDHD